MVENVTYMPNFISAVVMVGMLFRVMDVNSGLLANIYCALTGAKQLPFNAMASGWGFRHLYVWSGVWQGAGWGCIIYLASLSSVDPGLHEAAMIDGASRLQRIWHINIPCILPTATILLIMNAGSLLSVGFDKVFLLQNDLNRDSSNVIATYIYTRGLVKQDYSFSTAVGLMNNVINFFMVLLVNRIAKTLSDTSLF